MFYFYQGKQSAMQCKLNIEIQNSSSIAISINCIYSLCLFGFQSVANKPIDSPPGFTDIEEAFQENSERNEDEGWAEGHPVGRGDGHGTLPLVVARHKND